MHFTALDFETANVSPTSACSIGLVRVEYGEVVDSFYSLIKPFPFEFGVHQFRKHGITADQVLDSPSFIDIWPKIERWINGQVIVAHHILFDKNVLHNLLDFYNIETSIKDYLCSMELSRVELHQLPNHQLSTCYKVLTGLDHEGHHNALEDAKACAEVVLKILSKWRPPTFEKMILALYDAKPATRTNVYGKTKIRGVVLDELYKERQELVGSAFVFTGELSGITRQEAAQFVVNRGGKVTDSITSKTTQLVVAGFESMDLTKNNLSTKLRKAMDLIEKGQKLTVLSDQQFFKLMEVLQ